MDHFTRRDSNLCAEDVKLCDIASDFGTPTYVYSKSAIVESVFAFKKALGSLDYLLCYSVKTNSNLALLQLMKSLGCGFETVSGGELWRVLKAGGNASQTIFSGVGKTNDEINQALTAGVRYICVESEEELWAIRDTAALLGRPAPISMRINPNVDAKTHPHISTGLKENKFGVPIEDAPRLFRLAHADSHLNVIGVSCHIGSQITTLEPFVDAAQRIADLARTLISEGTPITSICMGGGLGIRYHDETPPDPIAYGKVLAEVLGPLNLQILLEPGRVLVGNAGVLLSQVVRTKSQEQKSFVILDAAMNDLMRPALYDAYHIIEPVHKITTAQTTQHTQDIVGPVCESSDTFAKGRLLQPLKAGDLVVLRTAGAYGFTMASNFNGRRRPAEVLVDGATVLQIRFRERVEDLWKGELGLDGEAFNSSLPVP